MRRTDNGHHSIAAADHDEGRVNGFVPVDFVPVDLDGMDFEDRYKVLSGAVVPRPIALVSTVNAGGEINVAPFSSFMIASVEAGYLAFSVGPSARPKTTLTNIRATKQFVINTVSDDMAAQVQQCGEQNPGPDRSAKRAHFTFLRSKAVAAPRVAEAKIHFECLHQRTIRFGDSHMVIGRIRHMHVRDGLMLNNKIDVNRYAPLGRIAGRSYCLVRDIITS